MTALRHLFLALGLVFTSAAATAADVSVAVAANFTEPAKELAAAFERATGNHLVLSFGPSGGFATQIAHGAPFALFLSADAERPAAIEAAGQGVPGTRFTYATGRLVLWSATPGLVDPRGAVLRSGKFEKLAIADPAAAPYGAAAIQVLDKLRLHATLQPKIVQGSSITQAYQYAATGAAELGFVALSQVIGKPEGSRWLVPARLHRPIAQQAILLQPGARDSAARAFWRYLRSPAAKAVIRRYGYEVR